MVNVVIITVFQAVGYLIGNTICVLPADECSDVGRTAILSIVLGANGTVEQTVVDDVGTIVSVADEAAGVSCVTMDTNRYPATLDVGVSAAAHKSGYVHVAADTARDVQILDGVVFGRSERAVSAVEVQRMAVAIEQALEVRSRMIYREVGIQNGIHALGATVA